MSASSKIVGDRFLFEEEVKRMTGYTRQHRLRLERTGEFPRRVQLGAGRVGWSAQEIDAWIEAKKASRPDAA